MSQPEARESGIVTVLAARAAELRAQPLTEESEGAARRAFVDWLGVTLEGSSGTPAVALLAGLGSGGQFGPSRIVGHDARAPAPLAALINGTAAHTLELDDIYAPGLFHPGAPVIAAALAAADELDAPSSLLWRAVVTGYEVGCRVAADLGPAHYEHWHTTGTAGALGAAAAAAEVRQAGPDVVAHALALAATMAGGLQQTFRSNAMGKPLHAGAAAQAGVIAAAAAAGGVTGALDVLEGPAGLAAATGSVTSWPRSRASLARPWAVESVTVKPHPCCGHAFAVIDAVAELRSKGVRAEDVTELRVQTYATALTVAGIAAPRTEAERRFSIPYLAAAALAGGPDGITADTVAGQPVVRALTDRIRLSVGEVFEQRFPQRRGARVTAILADGTPVVAEVPDRSGSPENPLTQDQIRGKFLAGCVPFFGEDSPAVLAALLRTGEGRVSDLDVAGHRQPSDR